MGIGGTAAAKENADIIILDNDFNTIVKVSYMICKVEMKNSVYRMQCNKESKQFITVLKAYLDNAGYPTVSISLHQYPEVCPIPAQSECLSRG